MLQLAQAAPAVPAAVPADQGAAGGEPRGGRVAPGEAIPSEIELAARFGVSQGTVRKAIDALAADNLVVRRQGKGTFVATHTEEKTSLFRFLRIRRNDGDRRVSGEPAARRAARQGVRRGRAAARAAQRRCRDRRCAACSSSRASRWCSTRSCCPRRCSRGLTRARVEAYRGSMYSFFETQFGVRMLQGAGAA